MEIGTFFKLEYEDTIYRVAKEKSRCDGCIAYKTENLCGRLPECNKVIFRKATNKQIEKIKNNNIEIIIIK